jgi:hypothetical protein
VAFGAITTVTELVCRNDREGLKQACLEGPWPMLNHRMFGISGAAVVAVWLLPIDVGAQTETVIESVPESALRDAELPPVHSPEATRLRNRERAWRRKGLRGGGALHVPFLGLGVGGQVRVGWQITHRVGVYSDNYLIGIQPLSFASTMVADFSLFPGWVMGAGVGLGGHWVSLGVSPARAVIVAHIGGEFPVGAARMNLNVNLQVWAGGQYQREAYWIPTVSMGWQSR